VVMKKSMIRVNMSLLLIFILAIEALLIPFKKILDLYTRL